MSADDKATVPAPPKKKKKSVGKFLSDLGKAMKLPPVSMEKKKPQTPRYGDPAARDSLMSMGYSELDSLEKRKTSTMPNLPKKPAGRKPPKKKRGW